MIFSIKVLTNEEKDLCLKTISPKAIYALVGDALLKQKSLSIVRMGDGEQRILEADSTQPFTAFESEHDNWNKRLGIEGQPTNELQQAIIEAGNSCTYFAPSISGISFAKYFLYQHFNSRPHYIDNFFVNDWTHEMIQKLFEASTGVYIIHRDYKRIIQNFNEQYHFKHNIAFDGCAKDSWKDNANAIKAATHAEAQLVLYSGGPGGKIIGPKIAEANNKIVLDVGNTLLPWSEGQKHAK